MAPLIMALVKSGLSLTANALLAKGQDWVKEKTGVNVDLGASTASPEVLLKLKQFELENESELRNMRLEEDKLDVEVFRLELGDKQSARQREVEMAKISAAPWWMPSTVTVLTFVVVIGGGYMLNHFESQELRFAVVSAITMVLTYYFGTTASSRRNGEAVRKLAETSGGQK